MIVDLHGNYHIYYSDIKISLYSEISVATCSPPNIRWNILPPRPGPAPSGGGAASGLISGRQARPAVARQRIPRCRPVVSPPRRCAARFPPVPPPINPAPIPEQVDERARGSRRVPPRPRAASPRLPRRLRRLPWCFPAGARRGGAHGDVAVVIVPVKRSDLKLLLFGFATLQHSTQPKNAKKTNHSV